MTNTIIAVFDDRAPATRAEQELIAAGFDRNAVSGRARESGGASTQSRGDAGGGFWETTKDMFGMDDDSERTYYQEAARRFFFQAEDGIRDKLVTGVQTCALPI